MIEILINDIEQAMLNTLNNEQLSQLRKILIIDAPSTILLKALAKRFRTTQQMTCAIISIFELRKSIESIHKL